MEKSRIFIPQPLLAPERYASVSSDRKQKKHKTNKRKIVNIKMKNKIISLLLLISLILSCEKQNLCDEGYKPYEQNGQSICIPEYLTGKTLDPKLGNTYYHDKYGVITIQNGIWKDENNVTIENIDK